MDGLSVKPFSHSVLPPESSRDEGKMHIFPLARCKKKWGCPIFANKPPGQLEQLKKLRCERERKKVNVIDKKRGRLQVLKYSALLQHSLAFKIPLK